MPRIQSRLHADELVTTQRALAAAEAANAALHQQCAQHQSDLRSAEMRNAALTEELTTAHATVDAAREQMEEVQSHFEGRERRLQERVRRLETDVDTLEELLQASRRRESAAVSVRAPTRSSSRQQEKVEEENEDAKDKRADVCEPSSTTAIQGPCSMCGELRAELQRVRDELTRVDTALHSSRESFSYKRPPRAAPAPPAAHHSTVSPSPTSSPFYTSSTIQESDKLVTASTARNTYWQDQLLCTTEQAAACFDLVLRHTRDLQSVASSETSSPKQSHTRQTSSLVSANVDGERWARQLDQLQRRFDEVVQADAKVISFLVLVAQQQSAQHQQWQQQWSEAQHTLQEADGVMSEAHAQVRQREEEITVLRQECATLTELKAQQEAQVRQLRQELQLSRAALQKLTTEHQQSTDAHARQLATLTREVSQSATLQAQATAYAQKLEVALHEKQELLATAAAAAHNAQQRREAMAATEARVAQFVAQLSRSAHELQTALTHLSGAPSGANDLRMRDMDAGPAMRTEAPLLFKSAPSVSSPDPSPPNRNFSAAGVSPSPSVIRPSVRPSSRSSPSVAYDDSLFLPDATQPFVY